MSSTHYDKVIIFGPTGGVGGEAALEASKRGAEVWLAMRDTAKPLTAISPEQESSGSFHRIKADLSDPDSVTAAVTKSGAKAAFVYHIPTQDGMRSSLAAMKAGGIEYVVFLSSYSVKQSEDDLKAIESHDLIPYVHAQIEINLEELNIAHTAVRPAQFASNPFNLSLDKTTTPWSANIVDGEIVGDGISPIDIGRVSGAVLVDRPASADPKLAFYLCGPQLTTEAEKWDIIKRVTGQEIDVKELTPEEWGTILKDTKGWPAFMVDYLVKSIGQMKGRQAVMYSEPFYSTAVANIKKYSGYEPQGYEEFVRNWRI